MQSRSRLVLLPLVVGVMLALTAPGCSSGSRDMRAPTPDQTTSSHQPVSREDPSSTSVEQVQAFELTTSAFVPGEVIPNRYTCQGLDEPPPLTWHNVPAGTQELAIVMRDLTTARVHWVAWGIDPGAGELPEGELPDSLVEARNDFDTVGWSGPCPDPGSGVHDYEIRIYALAEPLGLEAELDSGPAVERIETAASYGIASLFGNVSN